MALKFSSAFYLLSNLGYKSAFTKHFTDSVVVVETITDLPVNKEKYWENCITIYAYL